MYIYEHDWTDGVAAWVFHDATSADMEVHHEHLREVAAWSPRTGKRVAALLIARGGASVDARRRADLARLTEAPGYDPYVAFLTPNWAVRLALTMFGWVQRAPKYEMSFFDSSTSALGWLQKKRGEELPSLTTMMKDLRARYTEATGNELP